MPGFLFLVDFIHMPTHQKEVGAAPDHQQAEDDLLIAHLAPPVRFVSLALAFADTVRRYRMPEHI